MKRKLLLIVMAIVVFALVLAACEAKVEDGEIEGLDQLPLTVEVTGLEGVSGTAKVQLLSAADEATALATVKNAYYVATGAETYVADISIVDGEGNAITVDKPVTVTITLPKAKLPLDQYAVFHIHEGAAEEIVPTVSNGKLTFTVRSFSPFVVVPKHEHVFGDWTVKIEASACGEMGIEKSVCICGEERTRDYERRHDLTHHEATVTCTDAGTKEYWSCSACGKKFSDEAATQETTELTVAALGHLDKNADKKCDRCGAALGGASGKPEDDPNKDPDSGKEPEGAPVSTPDTYLKVGNKIYFGSYPQTKMTDATLLAALNAEAGAFPGRNEEEFNGWTSYKYYRGTNNFNTATNEFDFMFYKDVTYQGEKYRGVYMLGYRPNLTTRMATTDNTFQDDNGYKFGKGDSYLLYWFKFEPICWRILDSTDGVALVIADLIIDSQAYLDVANYLGVDEKGNSILMNSNEGVPADTYANNYAYSSIRAWLNDTFYNTAFTALQKSLIALTSVDNGITSSCPLNGNSELHWNNGTRFLCENTNDYVFLPSEVDITSEAYGFSDFMNRYANDKNRIRLYSDYALSQGLWAHGSAYTDNVKYGEYWLRSPWHSSADNDGYGAVCIVDEEGYCGSATYVCYTDHGVVPMLNLRLSD